MTTAYSNVVDATVPFVDGTFDAQDVRLATLGNALPGLFAAGDLAVTQRAAGANQSVDIAAGRVFIDPGGSLQGVYLAYLESLQNSSADLGLTWPASDGSNPRIDLLLAVIGDTAYGDSYTGLKFRVETGTPNASAAHPLDATYWPTIPTGCVPIAAIRRAAASTTIATADIVNLDPIGGTGRSARAYNSAAETTTSSSYARLTTPDHLLVYVPALAKVRFGFRGHWKISSASGTQNISLFIDGNQIKEANNGAPLVTNGFNTTIAGTANTYRRVMTSSNNGGAAFGWWSDDTGTSDASEVTTGEIIRTYGTLQQGNPLEIVGLAAGWHLLEQKYRTSANTLSVRERRIWAEVIG